MTVFCCDTPACPRRPQVQLLLLFLLIASQVDFVVGCFIGPQSDEERAQGFEGLSCESKPDLTQSPTP